MFQQHFENLIFKHPTTILGTNTITLDIKQARLQSTIKDTDYLLLKSTKSTEPIKKHYIESLQHLNIPLNPNIFSPVQLPPSQQQQHPQYHNNQ